MKPVTSLNQSTGEVAKPSVLAGDSIYYKHPETGYAHHGAVAAIGKHGMLVDAEGGGEHKVKWDAYIAHKARAERKLTIVDRGEDGSIMEDENGKRVFVHGALEDYLPPTPEEPLEKSLASLLDTDIVAAITRLREDQAAQFQGLCAAIALMAERIGDTSAVQQTLLAVLAEARKPQDVAIHLPESLMQKSEPANVQVDVHVPAMPQQAAPIINVEAPIINVAAAEAPEIVLNIPAQPAPIVNFSPHIDVQVPESPAPIVNVTIPPKNTVTTIERDKEGNMIRAKQTESAY
ncbi:hypothetical protein [Propionivibrio sp.]|uniref:hypothetical protein n=1 Tax=Propionivibrio sp. TaxID=2212460 RepID=UPI003BF18082